MDGAEIMALVNACNPWNKGAVNRHGQRVVRIMQAVLADPITAMHQQLLPGHIVELNEDNMLVAVKGSR